MSTDPPDPRPITEARFLAMLNASGDSFWELDAERRFVHVSDNMCRMLGYARKELRGRTALDLMAPEYSAEIIRLAELRAAADSPTAAKGPLRHGGEFFRKDGSRLWVETVSVPVFDPEGRHTGFFGITRDMSEHKAVEFALREANHRLEEQLRSINALHEQLREQAIRDELTGVHNRRHFGAVAEQELARARRHGSPLSLIMLDIDHFKCINDRHGHGAGDAALKAVGSMLVASTRVSDLASRLGGEEFAILLPGMSHLGALERAESWRATLAGMSVQTDDSQTLTLTASFGVATFPEQAADLVGLMKVADARMYRAKALGRDRVVGADQPS